MVTWSVHQVATLGPDPPPPHFVRVCACAYVRTYVHVRRLGSLSRGPRSVPLQHWLWGIKFSSWCVSCVPSLTLLWVLWSGVQPPTLVVLSPYPTSLSWILSPSRTFQRTDFCLVHWLSLIFLFFGSQFELCIILSLTYCAWICSFSRLLPFFLCFSRQRFFG